MTVKANDVLNLPLLSLENGEKVAQVHDIIYDPSQNRVLALLIDQGGWFSGAKVVAISNVKTIGRDAVVIESGRVIQTAGDVEERVKEIAKSDTYLTHTKVMTETGNELGKITDLYFDPITGNVEEFEVSQGAKDLQSGRKVFRIEDILKVGKDTTIVRAMTEQELAQQPSRGGAQGMINSTQQNVSQKAGQLKNQLETKTEEVRSDPENRAKMSSIKQTVQYAARRAKEKAEQIKETAENKTQESQQALQEQQKTDAVGQYLTKTILLRDDQVLANRGEMVTYDMLQRAEEQQLLDQVIQNVSPNPG